MGVKIREEVVVYCSQCGTPFRVEEDQEFSLEGRNSVTCPNPECGLEYFAIVTIQFIDLLSLKSNRFTLLEEVEFEDYIESNEVLENDDAQV